MRPLCHRIEARVVILFAWVGQRSLFVHREKVNMAAFTSKHTFFQKACRHSDNQIKKNTEIHEQIQQNSDLL